MEEKRSEDVKEQGQEANYAQTEQVKLGLGQAQTEQVQSGLGQAQTEQVQSGLGQAQTEQVQLGLGQTQTNQASTGQGQQPMGYGTQVQQPMWNQQIRTGFTPEGVSYLHLRYPDRYSPKGNHLPKVIGQIQKSYHFYLYLSFVYAIFFAFCYYRNWAGITAPIFGVSTAVLTHKLQKKWNKESKKSVMAAQVLLVLLGLSSMLTTDSFFIGMNFIGALAMLAYIVLATTCQIKNWNISDSIIVVFQYLDSLLACAFAFMKNHKIYKEFFEDTSKNTRVWQNPKVKMGLLGVLASIPVLLFVLPMLLSSDVVFEESVNKVVVAIFGVNFVFNAFSICMMIMVAFFFIYGSLGAWEQWYEKPGAQKERKRYEPMAAITFSGVLLVVYASYCYVQVGALFMGTLRLPESYTYAEYAREGFFQLVIVAMINLAIVIVGAEKFRESKGINIVLTLLTMCSYMMLVSAAYRMYMYVVAYGLTKLRVLALWMILVLFLLFALLLTYTWKKTVAVFQWGFFIVAIAYLLLSFSHVDYWIAVYDFEHENSVELDEGMSYRDEWGGTNKTMLSFCQESLSHDAAPAIFSYERSHKLNMTSQNKEYERIVETEAERMGLRGINVQKWYNAYCGNS